MELNKRGWIKLHRTVLRNPLIAGNERLFYVWVSLLLMVELDGTLKTGRIKLGKTLGINPRTLYDILRKFEKADMLKLVSSTQYTTVTITNWKEYQQVRPTNSNRFANRSKTGVNSDQTNMFDTEKPTGSPTLYKRSIKNKNIYKSYPQEELPGSERTRNGPGHKSAVAMAEILKARKVN